MAGASRLNVHDHDAGLVEEMEVSSIDLSAEGLRTKKKKRVKKKEKKKNRIEQVFFGVAHLSVIEFFIPARAVGTSFTRVMIRASDRLTVVECPICLCDFVVGENVARMDCFCLYHTHCLEAWFAKANRACCPTHIFDQE